MGAIEIIFKGAETKKNGSTKISSPPTDERRESLQMLIDQAENKSNHLDRLRQLNFSMTFLTFGGLFGFGLSQHIAIQLFIWMTLILFTYLLSDYDQSLHKYMHGWRVTKIRFLRRLSILLYHLHVEIRVYSYCKDGQFTADREDCSNLSDLKLFIEKQGKKSKNLVIHILRKLLCLLSILPIGIDKLNEGKSKESTPEKPSPINIVNTFEPQDVFDAEEKIDKYNKQKNKEPSRMRVAFYLLKFGSYYSIIPFIIVYKLSQ